MVKELLETGAHINAQVGWGKETALHQAASFGNEDVVKTLISSRR